jgi:putative addiction module component (TIGR02574 family)
MTTAQLEAEMMKLPRSLRARLAERLIESLDEDSEIERAWADEADKRHQAYLTGDESVRPLEDFLAAIRKEFSL